MSPLWEDVQHTLSTAWEDFKPPTLSNPWTAVGLVVGTIVCALVVMYPLRAARLPFRNLSGPAPSSVVFGSLADQVTGPVGGVYKAWAAKYGPTLRFRALLGSWRVVSTDLTAIGYVLNHTEEFHRESGFNATMLLLCGKGVLAVEDAAHKRQRKILSPAFSLTNVKAMIPVFWNKAYDLADALGKIVDDADAGKGGPRGTPEGARSGALVDLLDFTIRAALDVIGIVGFNYQFNAQKGLPNPLGDGFMDVMNSLSQISLFRLFQHSYPALFAIPTNNTKAMKRTLVEQNRIGKEIVAARKKEFEREDVKLGKGAEVGKDTLSLLLKYNMAPDLKPSEKLTDEEVLGQIGSLMLAGNETSATAMSWAAMHLYQNPDIQARLREEVDGVFDDRPEADDLMALPYLDKFVRELLRFDPPLPEVVRECAKDAVVPLSTPVMGRDGKLMDSIVVSKGTEFVVPINEINRSKEVWGPDADVFNPDRYDDATYPRANVPGVWGNLITFIGGPHNCLGWRFAILEIKTVLFVLLRSYEFVQPPAKPTMVRHGHAIVMRPHVAGEEDKGIQMPVLVRRVPKV